MKKSLLKYGTFILMSAFLTQCGGEEGESGKIDMEVLPESPFVRTVDTPIDADTTYRKNWFRMSIKMKNNSTEKSLTIVGFDVEVFDIGNKSIGKSAFDAAVAFAEGTGENALYMEELSPGEESSFLNNIGLVVDGVGEPTNPNSYHFKVVIKPIGWFGTYNSPESRFIKQTSLTTQ